MSSTTIRLPQALKERVARAPELNTAFVLANSRAE